MHSACPTSGRSARQMHVGHDGEHTWNWGNLRMEITGFLRAEFDDAGGRRPSPQYPAVTATGEGRP